MCLVPYKYHLQGRKGAVSHKDTVSQEGGCRGTRMGKSPWGVDKPRVDVHQEQTREALEREKLRPTMGTWFITSCLCRQASMHKASILIIYRGLMLSLFHCGVSYSELSFYHKELTPYDFPGDLFKICSKEQVGLFATENILILGLAANRRNILTSQTHL